MNPKTIFILAVIVAYAGVFLVFKRRYLSLFGGFEYILAGILLSFLAPGTDVLMPLLYPFLGWIGLLLGLQIRFSYLKGLPGDFYLKVILFKVSSVIVGAGFLYLLGFRHSATVAAIALASICYKSTAYFIPSQEKSNRFVLFFVSFIPFISILLLFLYYIGTTSYIHSLLIVSLVIIFSIILRSTLHIMEDRDSVQLLLIGFIVFVSEACGVLKISPIVVCFFIGIYVSNFSHWADYLFKSVYKDEKPLYILYLTLLGIVSGIAIDATRFLEILAIAAALTVIKYIFFKIKPLGFSRYRWYWFLAPGGFAIAVLTDYWLQMGAVKQSHWLSTVLAAIVIMQFLGIFIGKLHLNKTNKLNGRNNLSESNESKNRNMKKIEANQNG